MIEPDDRAAVRYTWSGSIGELPYVNAGASRQNRIVCLIVPTRAVVVTGAFGVFLIKDAVRMHRIRSGCVIFEKDFYGITHFAIKNGAKDSQILFFRGTCH